MKTFSTPPHSPKMVRFLRARILRSIFPAIHRYVGMRRIWGHKTIQCDKSGGWSWYNLHSKVNVWISENPYTDLISIWLSWYQSTQTTAIKAESISIVSWFFDHIAWTRKRNVPCQDSVRSCIVIRLLNPAAVTKSRNFSVGSRSVTISSLVHFFKLSGNRDLIFSSVAWLSKYI